MSECQHVYERISRVEAQCLRCGQRVGYKEEDDCESCTRLRAELAMAQDRLRLAELIIGHQHGHMPEGLTCKTCDADLAEWGAGR